MPDTLRMATISELHSQLQSAPRKWLITGVAGFIGSHLLEALLKLDQWVAGLDNFCAGKPGNLDCVQRAVSVEQWQRFQLMRGDIQNLALCLQVCQGVDVVLHQAALGSVPRSLEDPLGYHAVNVTGFLNVLEAARTAQVPRFVFASSSSVYGDHPALPKVESEIGRPLSPYAASKLADEIYAAAYAKAYGMATIGLRYFNVFGPRQDPQGDYAAVIPKWIASFQQQKPVVINGDGETSRDFCFVQNVVEANLLAATTPNPSALNEIYNIAAGQRTTLNELFQLIQSALREQFPSLPACHPGYGPERAGDIRHSHADISKARQLLGYEPSIYLAEGLNRTIRCNCGT